MGHIMIPLASTTIANPTRIHNNCQSHQVLDGVLLQQLLGSSFEGDVPIGDVGLDDQRAQE